MQPEKGRKQLETKTGSHNTAAAQETIKQHTARDDRRFFQIMKAELEIKSAKFYRAVLTLKVKPTVVWGITKRSGFTTEM